MLKLTETYAKMFLASVSFRFGPVFKRKKIVIPLAITSHIPRWDGPTHYGMWLVISSGMTIFFFLKTGLNLKETLAKNILAYVSVDFSIK